MVTWCFIYLLYAWNAYLVFAMLSIAFKNSDEVSNDNDEVRRWKLWQKMTTKKSVKKCYIKLFWVIFTHKTPIELL